MNILLHSLHTVYIYTDEGELLKVCDPITLAADMMDALTDAMKGTITFFIHVMNGLVPLKNVLSATKYIHTENRPGDPKPNMLLNQK